MEHKIRFCHFSDAHLGYRQYKSDVRENDFMEAFKSAIKICHKAQPDFIILTGDLFHYSEPSYGTIQQFFAICEQFFDKNPNVRVYLIPGNHDFPRRQSALKHGYSLTLFQFTRFFKNLILVEDGVHIYNLSPLKDAELLLVGMRYFHEKPFEQLGKILFSESGKQTMESHAQLPKILLLHQFAAGMPDTHEDSATLDDKSLASLNFDYIGFGHYHMYWDKPQQHIYTPGSTEHVSRAEWPTETHPERADRHVLTVDLVYNNDTHQWNTLVKDEPFQVRKKYAEDIRLGDITYEKAVEKIEQILLEHTPENAVVFYRIHGKLPPEEPRIFDFTNLIETLKETRHLPYLEIESLVQTEAIEVSESSETRDQILDEVLGKFFGHQDDQQAFHAMIRQIQDSEGGLEGDQLELLLNSYKGTFSEPIPTPNTPSKESPKNDLRENLLMEPPKLPKEPKKGTKRTIKTVKKDADT